MRKESDGDWSRAGRDGEGRKEGEQHYTDKTERKRIVSDHSFDNIKSATINSPIITPTHMTQKQTLNASGDASSRKTEKIETKVSHTEEKYTVGSTVNGTNERR